MTPPPPDGPTARFQRLRQLFEAAKERPPAEREAFVRRLAGADASLADEVLTMLRADAVDKTADLHAAGQAGLAHAADALDPDDGPRDDAVQSTATAELLAKLATSPKLDTNRYALEGEVGKGGMGVVMRIHDRHLNRRLAMKVLLERAQPRDDEEQQLVHQLLGRFLEEAQVTSQLDHPGVVPVHELGLDQSGKVYFTMRLVKGRTAGEIFALAGKRQEDWTPTRALEVVLKVCDTMAYAHSKQVLHRDLKPANVMVGRFGEVYVMDWGLAKVLSQPDRHDLRIQPEPASSASRLDTARKRDAESDSGSSVVSMDNQKLGTPSYMAPEQARSEALDQRADVYSIGAMLYELLTGQAPYAVPGLRQPAYRILEKVVEGPPKRIEDLTPGIPAELVAVVDKAMARDRDRRYANVTELALDLRAYLDQRVVRAYRTGALVEMQMWVRRNKALAASLVAAAVILVLGIASTTSLWFLASEQTRLAQASERRAKDQEALANAQAAENAKLAQEKGALAASETTAKRAALREKERAEGLVEELRPWRYLAGVVLFERAIANEADLYPAWPHKIEAMETWREDAGKLLAMQPEIERTVNDLEARALPITAEEVEADRRSHPKFAEYEVLTQRVASLRHAQSIRDGAPLDIPELTPEQQALDALALNSLAWPRVAPKPEERKVYGEEPLALAAARLAVQKAAGSASERVLLDTLAWALLANGQDAEAQQRSAEALAKTPANEKDAFVGYRRDLAAAVEG